MGKKFFKGKKRIMIKKSVVCFLSIYLFLYIINLLTPMAFGDDYLYSFVWQGKPMFVPLSEDAKRISSWNDLFLSQWSHYFTWSGRSVAHTLAQLFLWLGKDIFNFVNAFIGTILVAEIYWCINRGKISTEFEAGRLLWIFFVLWAFVPGFSVIFFWLTGSCNYLWTNVILLGFMIPYIHKYYYVDKEYANKGYYSFIMLFWGILAGWTNENSACWVIVLLFALIWHLKKDEKVEVSKWIYTGLIGLLMGYSLLLLAPGNLARYNVVHGTVTLSRILKMGDQLNTFMIVLFCQIFLWYFSIRAFFSLKSKQIQEKELSQDILLAKILSIIAFCMSATMLLAPEFPARSGFSGTIQLVVAAGILLRIQKEYGLDLIQKNAIRFLFYVGVVYFIMTVSVTLPNFYEKNNHMKEIIEEANYAKEQSESRVLRVKPFRKLDNVESWMSGFHIPSYELTVDENRWENVAFARYFGIKGIRMENDTNEQDNTNKDVSTINP